MVLNTVGTWFFQRQEPEPMSASRTEADAGNAPDGKRKRRYRRAARNRRRHAW